MQFADLETLFETANDDSQYYWHGTTGARARKIAAAGTVNPRKFSWEKDVTGSDPDMVYMSTTPGQAIYYAYIREKKSRRGKPVELGLVRIKRKDVEHLTQPDEQVLADLFKDWYETCEHGQHWWKPETPSELFFDKVLKQVLHFDEDPDWDDDELMHLQVMAQEPWNDSIDPDEKGADQEIFQWAYAMAREVLPYIEKNPALSKEYRQIADSVKVKGAVPVDSAMIIDYAGTGGDIQEKWRQHATAIPVKKVAKATA